MSARTQTVPAFGGKKVDQQALLGFFDDLH